MTPTQSPTLASQATAELPLQGLSSWLHHMARRFPEDGPTLLAWAKEATAITAVPLSCRDSHEASLKYVEGYEAGRASRAQSEPEGWRAALQFYAEKSHFTISEESAWDTVSGEPANFWCDEEGTATVEDGTVAAMALAGTPLKDEDDEPATLGETK